jgi:AraC-like DNA-binding protein
MLVRHAAPRRSMDCRQSAFHRHFRAVTAMSPLQFQKRIRLQEARSLLDSGRLRADTGPHDFRHLP